MTDKIKSACAGKSKAEIEAAIDQAMDIVLFIEAIAAFVVYFLLQNVSTMCADVYLAILFLLTLKSNIDADRKRMKEDYTKGASNGKTEEDNIEDKPH